MKPCRWLALFLAAAFALSSCPVPLAAEDAAPAQSGDEAPAPKPKKKGKPKTKKKGYDYEGSKYKSYRVLTDPEPRSYKFDAQGKPIPPGGKKKTVKKVLKKEKPQPPEDEIDGVVPLDEPAEKKTQEPSEPQKEEKEP